LHLLGRGVYAVGRPEADREGRFTAAVLSGGPGAVLSHESAAALWGIGPDVPGRVDVSVPFDAFNRPPGVRIHRRYGLRPADLTETRGIPITAPIRTVLDLADEWDEARLERTVNEADRLDLVDPEELRDALGSYGGERGVARLRTLLDKRTFRLTDSELERCFLRLVADAGLPVPLTRQRVNGFLVDFYWPDLGLVIETDGLRYHRTPAQQTRDQLRDQAHAVSGLTPLRFSHAQIRFEPKHVRDTLKAIMRRLKSR
jgi:very-short-patch-repair endonuclease